MNIKPEQTVVFERFSDSAGGYITLDPNNPQVFKTLIRAAKAKLKLRLKATVSPLPEQEKVEEEVQIPVKTSTAKAMEPVIVRSPVYQNSPRDSTAFDRRSVGSGIFQFKDARSSQQTLVNEDAPVPAPFNTDNKEFFQGLADAGAQRDLAFRSREPVACLTGNGHAWSVYCNECDKAMADAHYHCSKCDGGDYDLCEDCVATGKLCPGEGHWLIKRFIKDGKVINSTTERIGRKFQKPVEKEMEMPGAYVENTKTQPEEPRMPTRTCNSCVVVLPECDFVTCISCEDFDLCINCHVNNKHGHHPAHGFKPATEETTLPLAAETMLAPGRNTRHNAICDGCDKNIYGVRHKCLNCPDWDYCSDCVQNARGTHPRHRFAAIYTPIADVMPTLVRHYGIYCDGPLCSNKSNQSYIQGVRYKCAVCHDTDFCASCEALPSNHHNRTHPLIKFKTPVRNVSITTMNEDVRGNVRSMGDKRESVETVSTATETTPVQQANAATQVQTVAEIKPTEEAKEVPQAIPVVKTEERKSVPQAAGSDIPATLLNAHFVQDSIPDGMVVQPNARFAQIWTLKNPGPYAWPAGCSVRYVGGDNMLNVDNSHAASVTDIADATESNVVGREVGIGEEIAFKIVLKAPTREGKSISYWRLKAADGTPFGHRLWCDVDVKKVEEPKVEAAPAPVAAPAAPFPDPYRASFGRMAALRETQARMMQHQQMVAQQQAAAANQAAHNQQRAQQQAIFDAQQKQQQAVFAQQMRLQQMQRREHMMAQFNAQREHLAAQGIKKEDMPSWSHHVNPSAGSQASASASSSSSTAHEDDKARKEAAKVRVEAIKAKILKARAEKTKAMEEAKRAVEIAAQKKSAEETAKVQKIIEEATKAHEVEEEQTEETKEEDVSTSQMVFPKLEKESPTSSTTISQSSGKGKAAYVENEAGEVERSATPSVIAALAPVEPETEAEPVPIVSSPTEELDFSDVEHEFEVMSADGEESENDDGFLTDEEYDILDASDQETVASK